MGKRLLIIFFTLLLLIILPGIFISSIWSKMFLTTVLSQSANNQVSLSEELKQRLEEKKTFTLLLLGYGGGKHEGAYLTDSLLLVSINPAQKTISLLSIPRDLWVDMPNKLQIGDHWKINAMYAIGVNDKDFPQKSLEYKGQGGGINLAKLAVSRVTGLSVDRVVLVDFEGFKKGINILGGINVNVEKAFDDYEYPIDGKENDPCGKSKQELDRLKYIELSSPAQTFPCRYEHLRFKKGLQRFDGAMALKYVRSRHSSEDGTDFGRSARQRAVLIAIKKKVESPSVIPQIIPLLTTMSEYIKTDISLAEMQTLVLYKDELKSYSMQNFALTNENFLADFSIPEAGYVLIPKEGEDQWSTIQAWIADNVNGKISKNK